MKPNLVVIGAMKSGTTSFHDQLDSHRDISMSQPKEINFFSNPDYWKRGEAWYENHFNIDTRYRGESSTSYTRNPIAPDVPQRMHSYLPEAKLIYILRDPIDRFVSHYVHLLSDGSETRDFFEVVNEAVQDPSCEYVCQSSYYAQIQHFLEHYDRRQLLILTLEEFGRDTKTVLKQVETFLELDSPFPPTVASPKKNVSSVARLQRNAWVNCFYPKWLSRHPRIPWSVKSPFFHVARLGSSPIKKPELDQGKEQLLLDVFREDVQALKELTGQSFKQWRDY